MTTGIRKINGMWDIHSYYKTVYHTHMSYFLENNYLIDLCLVKCQDERWFIVDDAGEIQDDNLVDKYSEKFIEPRFFENEELVTEYALQVIHKISGVPINELKQFYSE